MRVIVDTNILIRAATEDDPAQAEMATSLLKAATTIAIPVPTLCEFAWVMARSYGIPPMDIADVIVDIVDSETVVTDLPAVQAGLDMLRAGGDFADGAIAAQGTSLGGSVFASFDRKAVRLWKELGRQAAEPKELL